MTEIFKTTAEIQPGDIVFNCPSCGKSLAIDPRGAGLIVTCPDCEHEVQVPESGAEVEAEAELEQALTKNITDRLEDLNARLESVEHGRQMDRERFEKISREVRRIQISLERISSVIKEVVPSEESPYLR